MTVRTALVLAGHGSHISPETAGLVWQQVDTLRRSGAADEVTAAFWKEAPSFHEVSRTLVADDITVVPLFTARGYFTQTVIPTEMGLTGPITHNGARTIRYARTLGEHPLLASFGIQRVRECLADIGPNIPTNQVAVAVIGHSTRLNPDSRRATEAQAKTIRAAGIVGEVVTVFLDDAPEIAEVYRLTTAPIIIAVPYFLASGSHVNLDVPRRLGFPAGQRIAQIEGRTVYYTSPIGADGSLARLILDLVYEAQNLTYSHSLVHAEESPTLAIHDVGADPPVAPERAPSTPSWHGFPQAGRQALIDSVRQSGILTFGQLTLTSDRVRTIDDGGVSFKAQSEISTPDKLRSTVRDVPFRPHSSACDLPGDWYVRVGEPEQLPAVVETIYPGAIADWAAYQAGALNVESLETVVARQTGMFRALSGLSLSKQTNAVESVCSRCVRHPTWHLGESPVGAIPCAAPCNWWMSYALKAVESQKLESVEA